MNIMQLSDIKNLHIPDQPGCYQYFDDNGKILYVGKASNLHNRVLSYWRESAGHSPAKVSMVKQIATIRWIETDSEIEALLLESNLIKKYQPPYNIMLRDDKRFVYIKISTEDDYPRIFATRKVDKAGRYFGPFTSTEAVRETLRIIRQIWPYRSCRTMPKKTCLYYQINKCPGVCANKIGKDEYHKIIKQIILFLSGEKKKIIKGYEAKIVFYKKELKKEKDIGKKTEIENQINFSKYQLKNLNHIIASSRIINVSEKYANDVVELAKILNLPKIPERIEGYDISNIFGLNATGSMVVFEGGEANKNEYRKFKIKIGQGEANDIKMLSEILERRFKHSAPQTLPSTGSVKILSDENKWPLPDLIIIDGGKGQVNATVKILKKFKINIQVIGISKGEGLRSAQAPDKLFFAGEKKSLKLPLASPALHLIKRVRDEAHRFAVSYHRKIRNKNTFA